MTEAVQVGILTAAAALGGVALQLLHASRERKRDRIFELRRQVFLEFAEASTKPLLYLAKIGNSEVSFNELGAIQQSALGPAAKMHGVARLETIRDLLTALDNFSASIFKLLPKRVDLEKFNHQISALAGQTNMHSARKPTFRILFTAWPSCRNQTRGESMI